MSSINGSCSQSSSLIHTPNPLQQRLNQPQAQHPNAGANPASPAAPGSGAIQLATALNAPANAAANPTASTPAAVPEANKGAYIDIHA